MFKKVIIYLYIIIIVAVISNLTCFSHVKAVTVNSTPVYDDVNEVKPTTESKKEKAAGGIKIKISGSVTETDLLKGKFVKKKGLKYFKKKNGGYAKNMFFTYRKNVYRADRHGVIVKGWEKYKNSYYYFDRSSGKLKLCGKADNFKISRYGVFKDNKYNLARVKVYLLAQKVVSEVTRPTDSKSEKLYKCYKWLAKYPYFEFRKVRDTKRKHPKDWDIIYARDIFDRHRGCCASEAAAFAYLAKACGYNNVRICSDTGHCWVDIDGRLYDPLFAEDRGFSKNYNSTYWDYRRNPSYYKKL